jgi:hypothetical protein
MTSLRNRRIGNQGHAFGTGTIYAASPNFWTFGHCDYEIELGAQTFPKEMRASRKRAKERGKNRVLRAEALKNETVVLFGPNVSAEQAVKLLRSLANQIKKRGLYTGETQLDQAVFERIITQL